MTIETTLRDGVLDLNRQADSLVAGLEISLSNSVVLMMKTQACHWRTKVKEASEVIPLFSSPT